MFRNPTNKRGVVTEKTPKELSSRWETEIGKKYSETIKDFIRTNSKSKSIDFSQITPPKEFEKLKNEKLDLEYIALNFDYTTDSGLDIENCTLSNCSFEYANFSNAFFYNVTFVNVVLDNVQFNNASLDTITIKEKTTVNGINIGGAEIIRWTGLTEESMTMAPMIYSKPSWLYTFIKTLIKVFSGKDWSYRKHTNFQDNQISKITFSHKEFKEYIIWYQHLNKQIELFHKRSVLERGKLFGGIVLTHYWSSYSVLAGWVLFFNSLSATIIYCNNTSFMNLGHDWLKAFYYCIATFTTLGYGDVFPSTHYAMLAAGIVAMVGYVSLGMLIYLVSRTVDKKF